MTKEITCRNSDDIATDRLFELHEDLNKSLNLLCGNLGLLYTGQRRVQMKRLLKKAEAAIEAGDNTETSRMCMEYQMLLCP